MQAADYSALLGVMLNTFFVVVGKKKNVQDSFKGAGAIDLISVTFTVI